MQSKLLISLMLLTTLLSACASQPPTLYQQLGGEQGIDNIVGGLINKIGEDPLIFHHFADTKISRFREQLRDHLCQITDGPCKYTGDSMIDVHAGKDINENEFNHLVDLLTQTMDELKISTPTQNRLLAKLAPLRGDIIYQ